MNTSTLDSLNGYNFTPERYHDKYQKVAKGVGLFERIKNSFVGSKADTRKHDKFKDISNAVLLTVGVIFGYSGGATESLVRSGNMLIYDIVSVGGLDDPVHTRYRELTDVKNQVITLQKNNQELISQLTSLETKNIKKPITTPIHTELPTITPVAILEAQKINEHNSQVHMGAYIPVINTRNATNEIIDQSLGANILPKKKNPGVPYDTINALRQEIQLERSIPGMEIQLQEQKNGRTKIWVSYNGRKSTSFFSTTPSHQGRLTKEGMKKWAEEKVEYLSCLEAIESFSMKNSIIMKKSSLGTQDTEKNQDFFLKISETEKSRKVRFLLSSIVDGKIVTESTVDFSTNITDINAMRLKNDFNIMKAKTQALTLTSGI